MLEPTSHNAFAWCRRHKSVMAENGAPSTHKCETFTRLQVCSSQVCPCRFIDGTCRARERNWSTIPSRRTRTNALEETRTVLQQRNQSVHNDIGSGIGLVRHNDGLCTTLPQKNLPCAAEEHIVSHRVSKHVEHQQKKSISEGSTTRATFR